MFNLIFVRRINRNNAFKIKYFRGFQKKKKLIKSCKATSPFCAEISLFHRKYTPTLDKFLSRLNENIINRPGNEIHRGQNRKNSNFLFILIYLPVVV